MRGNYFFEKKFPRQKPGRVMLSYNRTVGSLGQTIWAFGHLI